jgi:hypothetical protein
MNSGSGCDRESEPGGPEVLDRIYQDEVDDPELAEDPRDPTREELDHMQRNLAEGVTDPARLDIFDLRKKAVDTAL